MNDMDMHLKKLMAANNQNISDEKRILEININHELVNKLKSLDKNQKEKFCEILYDHAKLCVVIKNFTEFLFLIFI